MIMFENSKTDKYKSNEIFNVKYSGSDNKSERKGHKSINIYSVLDDKRSVNINECILYNMICYTFSKLHVKYARHVPYIFLFSLLLVTPKTRQVSDT